ncbi:threonine synthase [Micavibrio aeruginosavorus]|uniref:Threonine synthase n=1 Tax=Micavibrio aeruginosavorus EPB TaxID=349215 RepID=M4VKM0_9BACT|nr:threonine synthase [Micavibrio aeruginosavorus]AGH99035.1 Threonine synthase [Micavibrio aeruginosavorus EPB]
MIRYVSTRGPGTPQSFTDVMLAGLAPDSGLYIPDMWPEIDRDLLSHLAGTPYTNVAMEIMTPFVGKAVPPDVLFKILQDTYEGGSFDHACVAPLVQVGPSAWIMELFHGPTLSFKDYALQFIGRLFDYLLEQKGQRLTIIGATSGDTGSAAIEACRNCKNIDIFILHPKGRTSEIQRRQMTTVDAPNVFNIAVEGTFDDCQTLVKTMLGDAKMRGDLNLSAINSINWARIMAQIVYYATAALALGAPHRPVSFAVPTGNFGNVYAGWCARRIGLPIDQLIVATNKNDILTRFFETGDMRMERVTPTLSPSMDIQISSNFERYLCDLMGRDYEGLKKLMHAFKVQKAFIMNPDSMQKAKREFTAQRCDDDTTLQTMRECYLQSGVMIDPHTAVGLYGAMTKRDDPSVPVVALACAHPAKFPDAVEKAIGIRPPMPAALDGLLGKAEHYIVLPNDLGKVQAYIRNEAKAIRR